MGGLFFLLALVYAAATGGGVGAFIIALITLNIAGSIIYRASGRRERDRQLRRPTGQPRQVEAPRQQRQNWDWSEFWKRLEEWGENSEWNKDSERDWRRRPKDNQNTTRTDVDDRYVRGQQPTRRNLPIPPRNTTASSNNRSTRTTSTQRAAATTRPEAYPHANEATRRAGLNENAGLSLSDIGLIVYGAGPKPVVHRESAVPDTVDYVQPFAELKANRAAKGRLTFELLDPAGEVVYLREEDQQLRAGKTSVIPRTRLPIGDHFDLSQGWTLRIYANNVLIAEHPFGWYNPTDRTETLREVMSNDGELTADLSALMVDIQAQPMSLDDLLGGDDNAASQKQARR
jgi:hypothetical protein